jgi:hypothetical protein
MMSLVHDTSAYHSPKVTVDRKHPEFGVVLALLCVAALALVAASAMIAPAPIGSGITSEIFLVGP